MTDNELFWIRHDLKCWAWYYGHIALIAGIVIAVFIWLGVGEKQNALWGL